MGKILVVDDDAMNLRMAEFMLGKKGHEVVKAESGSEAIEMLSKDSFDLVLLDIEMPDMDGIETLAKVREDACFDTPVAFLSGAEDIEELVEKYQVQGFIKKPFMPQEIQDKVEKLAR
ncbi:MAG: response regulator [Lachnospiraceae bacterium]|nr:response regulator [Lachnospiraceae bacterium]